MVRFWGVGLYVSVGVSMFGIMVRKKMGWMRRLLHMMDEMSWCDSCIDSLRYPLLRQAW